MGILSVENREQCIFDDQKPAKFLGRNFEFPSPVSGRPGWTGIEPRPFEDLT